MTLMQKLLCGLVVSGANLVHASVINAAEANAPALQAYTQNYEASLTNNPVSVANKVLDSSSQATTTDQPLVDSNAAIIKDVPSLLNVRSAEKFTSSSSAPQLSTSILKMLGGLAIVVTFILLIAALARRAGLAQVVKYKKIHLRETIAVGTKERLVLVDFYGQSLLLGVSQGGIALLKTVPQSHSDMAEPTSLGAKTVTDFQQKLNAFLLKGQK